MRKSVAGLICGLLSIGLVAAAQGPQPIPITGNLGTIIGTPQPYAGVLIQLQNCPNPVRITGYQGIVALTYQLQANASGQINSTIWPNDLISCDTTTGASMYSEVEVVNGVPSGQPLCYQVTSAQGIWNLNTQQPIACQGTPPNPQDATFQNLVVTNFAQIHNGEVTGAFKVDGSLQLGTASQTCPSGYMTGLTDLIVPICAALPPSAVTSVFGRPGAVVAQSGDYSYGQISGTPTLYNQTIDAAGTPLAQQPVVNFDGTVACANGSGQTNCGLPNVGTAGTVQNPASITTDAQGRVTAVTPGGISILAVKTQTSCPLGPDVDGQWSCAATVSWGSPLPSSTYQPHCDLTYPNTYCSGSYNCSAAAPTSFNISPGSITPTGFGYILANHDSGSNAATFSMRCFAVSQ